MTVLKTKPMAIHYAGELRTKRLHILPGFAACCSGDKAWRIRVNGSNTKDSDNVTCQACLKRMQAAREYEHEQLQKAMKEPTYE
jgi:hypothetical protein